MGHSLVTPANIDELHHTAGDRLEVGGLAMTLAGLLITNMSLLSPPKTCQFDRYYHLATSVHHTTCQTITAEDTEDTRQHESTQIVVKKDTQELLT